MVGRNIKEEWGIEGNKGASDDLVTCVSRFGRDPERENDRHAHVTGVRMARSNGHEVGSLRLAETSTGLTFMEHARCYYVCLFISNFSLHTHVLSRLAYSGDAVRLSAMMNLCIDGSNFP